MTEKPKRISPKEVARLWNGGEKARAVEVFKTMPEGINRNIVMKQCEGINKDRK
jgi:hypothetical protein